MEAVRVEDVDYARSEEAVILEAILAKLTLMDERLCTIEANTKVTDEEISCVARESSNAVLVNVRINISSVADIDTVSQEFTCEFFLAATWEEPELKGQYIANEIDWGNHWDPRIYFVNAVEIKSCQKKHKVIRMLGNKFPTVQLSFRVVARFKSLFSLHNFPFDYQPLKIQISSKWSSLAVVFDTTPNIPCVLSNANFLGQEEWDLLDHVISKASSTAEDSCKVSLIHYSVFTFEFHIKRKYSYFLTNIVFLMFLISLLSFTTFFVSPDNTGERLSVILTLLLTAVTFKFVVSQSLPPVSYLTVLDWYVLTSVIFIFAVAIENSIVAKIQNEKKRKLFDNVSWGVAGFIFVIMHMCFIVKSVIIMRRARIALETQQRCYKWKNGLFPTCDKLVSASLRNISTSSSPSPQKEWSAKPERSTSRNVTFNENNHAASLPNKAEDEPLTDRKGNDESDGTPAACLGTPKLVSGPKSSNEQEIEMNEKSPKSTSKLQQRDSSDVEEPKVNNRPCKPKSLATSQITQKQSPEESLGLKSKSLSLLEKDTIVEDGKDPLQDHKTLTIKNTNEKVRICDYKVEEMKAMTKMERAVLTALVYSQPNIPEPLRKKAKVKINGKKVIATVKSVSALPTQAELQERILLKRSKSLPNLGETSATNEIVSQSQTDQFCDDLELTNSKSEAKDQKMSTSKEPGSAYASVCARNNEDRPKTSCAKSPKLKGNQESSPATKEKAHATTDENEETDEADLSWDELVRRRGPIPKTESDISMIGGLTTMRLKKF